MKKSIYLCLFMIIYCFLGCGEIASTDSELVIEPCFKDSLSFKNDIEPILISNCYECHNSKDYARKADGNKLEGYEAVKMKVNSNKLIQSIRGDQGFIRMPYRREKLDSCDILIIEEWINQGALDN